MSTKRRRLDRGRTARTARPLERSQGFVNGASRRASVVRPELAQGQKNKRTLVHRRMRHDQARAHDLLVSVEKQIEVNLARPPAKSAGPSEIALDALQDQEELDRPQRRRD